MKSWLKVFSKVAIKHEKSMNGTINFSFIDVDDYARYSLMLFKFGYKRTEGTKLFFVNLDKTTKPTPTPTFWDAPIEFRKFDERKVDVYFEKFDSFVQSIVDGT